MRKHIVAPLSLLASLSLLTSCTTPMTDKSTTPKMPLTPNTESNTASTMTNTATSVVLPPPPVDIMPPVVTTGSSLTWSTSPVSSVNHKQTVSYDSRTPEGNVEIEFDVTVSADGVITAVSATPKTDKQWSVYNQTNFSKDISSKAVGKSTKDLKLDAVGGASLTTAAFESFVRSF